VSPHCYCRSRRVGQALSDEGGAGGRRRREERQVYEGTYERFVMARQARLFAYVARWEAERRHLIDPGAIRGGSCDVFTDSDP
jgi:hypothetical protein